MSMPSATIQSSGEKRMACSSLSRAVAWVVLPEPGRAQTRMSLGPGPRWMFIPRLCFAGERVWVVVARLLLVWLVRSFPSHDQAQNVIGGLRAESLES